MDAGIGLLGGTFDPIHVGHLIIAEAVRQKFGLDHVLFIPTGQPWLKACGAVSESRHRVNMTKIAIESNPDFRLSILEVERPGPTYTVDTLRALRRQLGEAAGLVLIMGWDSLAELPKWREPADIVRLCRVVAVPRPGFRRPRVRSLNEAVPGLLSAVTVIPEPVIGISSSDIRQMVKEGLSVKYLVPERVESYIQEHRLYK